MLAAAEAGGWRFPSSTSGELSAAWRPWTRTQMPCRLSMPLTTAASKTLGGSCGAKPVEVGAAAATVNAGSRLWL